MKKLLPVLLVLLLAFAGCKKDRTSAPDSITPTTTGATGQAPAQVTISSIAGDTIYNQTQVDAFVARNVGKQLKITGNLYIIGTDITSVSGLSNITAVSGTLLIANCPLLNDLTFLNNITSVDFLSIGSLGAATITMDHLTTMGSLSLYNNGNINKVSFASLTATTGINISSCPQLTDVTFGTLKSVSGKLSLTATGLTNLIGFKELQSLGSLLLSSNTALINLHGLEHLATLTSPAIDPTSLSPTLSSRASGVNIASNAKLTSLTGLQNVTNAPFVYIISNAILNDFCPFKGPITAVSTLPAYSYSVTSIFSSNDPYAVKKTVSTPALTLTNNGNYTTTQDALAAVGLCK